MRRGEKKQTIKKNHNVVASSYIPETVRDATKTKDAGDASVSFGWSSVYIHDHPHPGQELPGQMLSLNGNDSKIKVSDILKPFCSWQEKNKFWKTNFADTNPNPPKREKWIK